MGNPRHLWSGNWESDSAAHADELARRRAALGGQDAGEEELPPAPAEEPQRTARRGPRTRVALLVGVGALIVAAAAVALFGSGSSKPKTASRPQTKTAAQAPTLTLPTFPSVPPQQPPSTTAPAPPPTTTQAAHATPPPPGLAADARWLGVEFAMLPQGGVTIETVTRGGAADNAGLEPGDALSQIDGRPINTFEDIVKAFAPLHPGSQITIIVNRGSTIYTTSFPMPPRPPKGP
jgi:membrane-associated protease RseP (regulator of RpoE activity)